MELKGVDIPLGQLGSFSLAPSVQTKISSTVSNITPDWLENILMPKPQVPQSVVPQLSPTTLAIVGVSAVGLILVLMAGKKKGRRKR